MNLSNFIHCGSCDRIVPRDEFTDHECDPKIDNRELNKRLIRIEEMIEETHCQDCKRFQSVIDAAFEFAERCVNECEMTLDYGPVSKQTVAIGHQLLEVLVRTEQGL